MESSFFMLAMLPNGITANKTQIQTCRFSHPSRIPIIIPRETRTMMQENWEKLRFFIGIDSDGCVFDTMETKHRDAFVPAMIQTYGLEHIAGIVEEVWCFVNLYSRDRGINRFLGLIRTVEELQKHPVLRRFPGVLAAILPDLRPLRAWAERTQNLSNDSLEAEIRRLRDIRAGTTLSQSISRDIEEWIIELERCLAWSVAVNALAKEHVSSAEAFPNVYNFLRMINPDGIDARKIPASDTGMVVISQSPAALLESQWRSAGFSRYMDAIHGQEDGNKSAVLQKYLDRGVQARMLVIGDAPGDLEAARKSGAWFFPIIPRHEAESWSRLAYEGWPLFATGCYNIEYQNRLLDDFFAGLPAQAPWEDASLRHVS
jgi:beta-phosphoglucomutase-like phosphatase (HAD superfamily)